MKTKTLLVTAVAAVLIFTAFCFAACGDAPTIENVDQNLGIVDPDLAVDGMSAYDLVMEAYENWCNDDGYIRREEFAFSAKAASINAATRQTYMIRKVDGDKIYSQEVILGTGLDDGTKAIRYYFDGTSAWDLENTDKKDISIDETTGRPITAEWGEFVPYQGDVAEQNRTLTEHLTTYDISSREYLSDAHNDSVYNVDGAYYCTLTIDCSEEMMNTVHRAAKEEFLANTGAKDDGFSIQDTTIDFAIGKVDGEYKFLAWKRNEKYTGKHASVPMNVNCEQTCYSTYEYTGYTITADDLLNLA